MMNSVPKILIIDDIKDNIQTIKALVKKNFPKAVILSSDDGDLGIELATSTIPNLILLDVLMPKKDGFEVCRDIKSIPKLSDVPIVFVTALKESHKIKIEAIDAGAEGFLTKPIDEAELITMIKAMLKLNEASIYKKAENDRLQALVDIKTKQLRQELEKRTKTEKALELVGNIFENSITNAPVPIMIHAEDGTVLNISKTASELTLYTKEDIPTIFDWTYKAYGKNADEVIDFIQSLYKLPDQRHDGEFTVTTKDNRKLIWDFNSGVVGKLPDGRAVAMSVATDVTERIAKEKEILYLSYHDSLTGLHNRRYYEDNLVSLDVPENYPLTIVVSDINGLKLINDAFGHTAGDKLLKTAARLIRETCRDNDLVARIGGDEFVIVMPKTDSLKAEKLIADINQQAKQFKIESIALSISFGFETKHEITQNIQDIYRSAEDRMYRVKLNEIPSMRSGAIETILNTLYEKDVKSEIHSRTVSSISEQIAIAHKMNRQEIAEVRTAGLLHDIGKIIIPSAILTKEGKLSNVEYDSIKSHPEIGFRILNSTHDMRSVSNFVLSHHERWDGTGYPRGLKENEIPLQSRIIAIADAFDAMTSPRTYREVFTYEQAIDEIVRNAGTQFDPDIANLFVMEFHNIKKCLL